jgi:hypothetical protein
MSPFRLGRRHETQRSGPSGAPRFHIIFMPGPVRRLALFTLTLLDWSEDCDFVLVANACSAAERTFLSKLAQRHQRLHYREMSAHEPLRHGAVLNHLLEAEDGTRFCFLDNDILADGEFLPPLVAASETYSGVFACPPVWTDAVDRVHHSDWRHLGGRYHVTDSGLVVGVTHLAMYDIAPLREVLQSGGRFEKARWAALEPAAQADLAKLGMEKDDYDTGKVVNLMLAARGYRLVHLDTPSLHHIGGFDSVVSQIPGQEDLAARRAAKLADVPAEERDQITARLLRREVTASYVDGLLRHLFDGSEAPSAPHTGDDAVDGRLVALGETIRDAYTRHAPELESS